MGGEGPARSWEAGGKKNATRTRAFDVEDSPRPHSDRLTRIVGRIDENLPDVLGLIELRLGNG